MTLTHHYTASTLLQGSLSGARRLTYPTWLGGMQYKMPISNFIAGNGRAVPWNSWIVRVKINYEVWKRLSRSVSCLQRLTSTSLSKGLILYCLIEKKNDLDTWLRKFGLSSCLTGHTHTHTLLLLRLLEWHCFSLLSSSIYLLWAKSPRRFLTSLVRAIIKR